MISAVARTFKPGCKADHVLVLEGPQGSGKSTGLCVLAGEDYFGDDVPPVGSKDAQQYLGSLWIVELAEMDAATRAQTATLKRFLTTTIDRYRPPYGRRMIQHRRRCVFAGTVNKDEYLRDPTGGRRFWPVQCGRVDLNALARDRDQLWAEAVAAYRACAARHLEDAASTARAAAEQAKRLESDPWEDPIASYVNSHSFVTTNDVLTQAIGMELKAIGKREKNRVGSIMRQLGWKYSEGDGEGRQRGWKRQ